jgi:predicted signal transduction protein with EAL and GGDEF domain
LLREVAARLVHAVGSRGLVARLGGDEFGVLLPEIHRAEQAQSVGSEILAQVNGPVLIKQRQVTVSACCGIGLSRRGQDKCPSRILADADLALYQAKDDPGREVAVFEQQMEAPHRRRAEIERALQAPGVRDNLRVVFQPIFDLKRGRVIAHEALARWTDGGLGAVSPAEFVPIAEQLNVIDEINSHLMAIAFEEARGWPDHVKLSFNLSAVQLRSAGSASAILGALKTAGLATQRLQVEVTETALLADFKRARENLTQLRKAGVIIVLDDFGAGYASIGYLRELRFDQIKLDGGLVTAARHSADGKRLLRAVIGLCEVLGVSTVAEHVESEDLLRLVIELGCTAGQGFWLRSPVPAGELRDITRIDVLRAPREPSSRAA